MSDSGIGQIGQGIIDEVDIDGVNQRQYYAELTFYRMRNILQKKYDVKGLEINSSLLNNSIHSYWYDITRTKKFHGIDRINKAKVAAYTLKWLMKGKAIYFDGNCNENLEKPELMQLLSYINEAFAFRVACGYAGIKVDEIDEWSHNSMVYQLLYRNFDVGFVAFWFETYIKLKEVE